VIGVDDADLPALARGPRRHEFLLRATGSDYAAVAEIRAAERLIAGQDRPDLRSEPATWSAPRRWPGR
jgi:hypothetical protein